MDYSSGVWGYKDLNYLESVQNRAMRFYLGVNRFASNHVISGDMGWESSHSRRKLCMIRLWNRLMLMPDARLTKQIFIWDYSVCRNTWSTEIKKVFEEIDMLHCYVNLESCNIKIAHEKLLEREKTIWSESIVTKPKLRTYIQFKESFCTENFVLYNLSHSERSLMAQLRAGILPLRLETGRYTNTPVDERLCAFCNGGCVENEMHFVFECDLYNELRKNLFSYVSSQLNDFCTLNRVDMLKCLFRDFPRQFSKFIKNAFDLRSRNIYR